MSDEEDVQMSDEEVEEKNEEEELEEKDNDAEEQKPEGDDEEEEEKGEVCSHSILVFLLLLLKFNASFHKYSLCPIYRLMRK